MTPLIACRIVAVAAALTLVGCATTKAPSPADPLEPLNRAAFAIHEPIDREIVRPAIQAYIDHVPYGIRQTVSSFFNNLEDFFSGINGLLQNKPEKAGHDFGRVIVNSLWGLGGLIDWATEAGIPRGEEDFGQTFGYWGIPQGPYLFIPLFGPTTVRDGSEWVIRAYATPIRQLNSWEARWALFGIGYVDVRARLLETQGLVDQAALDPYTFLRRSYLQRREFLTYDGKPPKKDDDE